MKKVHYTHTRNSKRLESRLSKRFAYLLVSSFLFSCMFIQPALAQSQQIFVNKFWNVLNANPVSGVDWSASVIDPFGNLITAGNTVDANFQVNLLLIKQSSSGQVLWQQEFSAGTDTKNYGIALTTDNSGNIYVAGASFQPANLNHDYLTLKYNASGILQWSHLQNGADNGEDIPSDIAVDNSGNVYVTGGSYGNSTDYDYLTIRLDASGNFNWKKRYDYNNLMDGAGALVVSSSYVRVTGASASSVTDWDYASLRYNAGTGAQVSVFRAGANGTGLDTPTSMALTSNNDMVVTGYGGTGATHDCYTVMLDENFNLLWEAWYDGGDGLDDRAYDVEVDEVDNVYVCGMTQKANGGSVTCYLNMQVMVLKYGAENAVRVIAPKYPKRCS